MAPEVALSALSEIPAGGMVLDPMAGSGTVLRAAVDSGLRARGVDVDPLAVLIARVWTTPLNSALILDSAEQVVDTARTVDARSVRLNWIDGDPATRRFVRFWFAPRQRGDLRRLVFAMSEAHTPTTRALRLALSRTIITKDRGASLARDVAHSRPHRVRRDNDFDVFEGFVRAAARIAHALEQEPPRARASVGLGDARDLRGIENGSVTALVSSPPYLNAIDYMRGHRLSLVWLGYTVGQLSDIRSGSIGAERVADPDRDAAFAESIRAEIPSVSGLSPRFTRIFDRYLADLHAVLREAARVLAERGRAVFVIGNSTLRGVYVDNAAALMAVAARVGLVPTGRYERKLPSNHRYLPPPDTATSDLAKRMRAEVVLTFALRK